MAINHTEILDLVNGRPPLVIKPMAYTGLGDRLELQSNFSAWQAVSSIGHLIRKLHLRMEGGYHVDDGVTPFSISWMSLRHVSIDDQRIEPIANSIGAIVDDADSAIRFEAKLRRRDFKLGNAILRTVELKGYDGVLMGTYLGLNFDPYPKIDQNLRNKLPKIPEANDLVGSDLFPTDKIIPAVQGIRGWAIASDGMIDTASLSNLKIN